MTDAERAPDDRGLVALVESGLLPHPAVRAVVLVGSRAVGTPTSLSDWDFVVEVDDFPAVEADLPLLVSRLEPLAQQWDRLSSYACYMLMLSGPVKVDLIFPDVPFEDRPPWAVKPETMDGIDQHFWDWILWMASKRERGKLELVRAELEKMSRHLLRPMGVPEAPASIPEAIAEYRGARDRLESTLGVRVSRQLEHEVLRVVPSD